MPRLASPAPLGFPRCARCPYVWAGDGVVCLACVRSTHQKPDDRCDVCERPLRGAVECRNPVCNWSDRHVSRVHALTLGYGPLYARAVELKEDASNLGWATILGRLVTAWLTEMDRRLSYDLILVNPTHADRVPRHMEAVLSAARSEDTLDQVPYDDPLNPTWVKHHETASSRSRGWWEKKAAAEELYGAIRIERPARVVGSRVLVLDDVTTTLHQQNVLADILRRSGAVDVEGLVIARALR